MGYDAVRKARIVMLRFGLDKHILNLIVLGLRLTQILEK